jgi:hypothetical protein
MIIIILMIAMLRVPFENKEGALLPVELQQRRLLLLLPIAVELEECTHGNLSSTTTTPLHHPKRKKKKSSSSSSNNLSKQKQEKILSQWYPLESLQP